LRAKISILADVNVKHAAPLAIRPVAEELADLVQRGGADALIVSGAATGKAADLDELREVKAAAGNVPVLVGSGVTAEAVSQLLPHCDGLIVGTSLKADGRIDHPVDAERVRALVRLL
jgi:membrane complex biogenesis BtpA family protein